MSLKIITDIHANNKTKNVHLKYITQLSTCKLAKGNQRRIYRGGAKMSVDPPIRAIFVQKGQNLVREREKERNFGKNELHPPRLQIIEILQS